MNNEIEYVIEELIEELNRVLLLALGKDDAEEHINEAIRLVGEIERLSK